MDSRSVGARHDIQDSPVHQARRDDLFFFFFPPQALCVSFRSYFKLSDLLLKVPNITVCH